MFALKTRFRLLALAALLVLPLGCVTSHVSSQELRISGTVSYRERMALPPQAELHLALYQIFPNGSRERTIEHQSSVRGQIPLPFDLKSPASAATCELEAAILADGQTLFATPEPVAVQPGDTDVHLLLHRVFSESESKISTLPTPADLVNKYWALSSLYGKPVQKFADQPEPHLLFTPEPDGTIRVAGSDGCNRLVGTCRIMQESIRFSHMGSTMMLCPFGEEQARAFAQALAQTTGWRFENPEKTRLELLNSASSLLVLEARTN